MPRKLEEMMPKDPDLTRKQKEIIVIREVFGEINALVRQIRSLHDSGAPGKTVKIEDLFNETSPEDPSDKGKKAN
jgi:hypothetical protein